MHFIGRGAEAILYKKNGFLIKKRIVKGYRLQILDDKLRKERTAREIRLLVEARRNNVSVPSVIEKDIASAKIVMEFIEGEVLRDALDNLKPKKLEEVCKLIGESISKLHTAGIVHGDLTTSNMILNDGKVYIVDFGLGKFSTKIEDFAVELYLLKRALIARHNKIWEHVYDSILKNYKVEKKKEILKRISEIEKRGRYSNKD